MTGNRVETARDPPMRFPLGLTLAAVVVFVVCCGLGVWQLQRADWKSHELARIATLRHALPTPIGPVLARAAKGGDVTFTRVVADCAPGPARPGAYHMTSDNGEWIARVLSVCAIRDGPFNSLMIDRGFLDASRGQANPAPVSVPAPVRVVGVLYAAPVVARGGADARMAPDTLVAERETPPAPGVTPAPYPDAGDNLQYVGAYWLTWFGLAGAVACVYAAMLWRRHHPKR
jgi:surfeit locus 1 family protein